MSSVASIDDEWEQFLSSNNGSEDEYDFDDDEDPLLDMLATEPNEYLSANLMVDLTSEAPKASEIYISTKTIIAYLNIPIDLQIFWDLPVIHYHSPVDGIVKKQIRLTSLTQSELDAIQEKVTREAFYEEHVTTHIDNPSGRIPFKDVRKISIGISRKDIMSYRFTKKNAFYNCFALILRLKINGVFKEFHVKVFNTGKVEVPGIQQEEVFQVILQNVVQLLQPFVDVPLSYRPDSETTVLINSNFNCGFFVNREALYDVLRMKYGIDAIYDPCSYPGVKCNFYYNPDVEVQTGRQISEENKHLYKHVKKVPFMIFRTGSALIVGKCDEHVLLTIYEFLKVLLNNEYKHICQKITLTDKDKQHLGHAFPATKDKTTKKVRRKTILVDRSLWMPSLVEGSSDEESDEHEHDEKYEPGVFVEDHQEEAPLFA